MPRETKGNKFDGLQAPGVTDELFTLPAPRRDQDEASGETSKTQRAATSGVCEGGHTVGLLVQGEHLVWREHTYPTWASGRIACRTSGVRVCDSPAKTSMADPHAVVPTCTCQGYKVKKR